jgi:hypothetical protein
MLFREEYIRLSLELNLFFGRIAKEHSIFIETSFTGKDQNLAREADSLKVQFETLLSEAISLANGAVSQETLNAQEFITPHTLDAERVSQLYTWVPINSSLTQAEAGLAGNGGMVYSPALKQRVFMLNQKAVILTTALLNFKTRILNNVLACKLFTTNYPLLLDHIIREAKFYLKALNKLQNREDAGNARDLLEQEVFWNRIMAEHSFFIRGLLDPTENELISTANDLGEEFNKLTRKAIAATEQTALLPGVTAETYKAAKDIKAFKNAGTEGLINCKIKAIAYPLLGDHVLREANHYLRILRQSSFVQA